jgi:surface protein
MNNMFRNASTFNQPINYDSTTESWNVSNVIDMSVMFGGAIKFSYDISNWNVSKVTTMIYMFNSTTNFNQDISNWNVSNVTSFTGFALDSGLIEQHIPPRFR